MFRIFTKIWTRLYSDTSKIKTMSQILAEIEQKMNVKKSFFADARPRDYLMQYVPECQSKLEPRSLEDSHCWAIIPLSTDLKLQDRYVGYMGKTRIGRILEDMDSFACYVLMKHIKLPKYTPEDIFPYYPVTAHVDKIDFMGVRPLPQIDLRISGHVSWVGKTSAEITIWLKQMRSGKLRDITRAIFVLVARNPLNTGGGIINPLKPQNDNEKEIVKRAIQRKQLRDEYRNTTLLKIIPSSDEQILIHSLFLKTVPKDDIAPSKSFLPKKCLWVEQKWLKNIFQAHPEHRNMHNMVFGGFIMRQAHELSWNLAILFSKPIQRPKLKRISDIKFIKPIELNSIISMTAEVAFTQKGYLIIRVVAQVVETIDIRRLTNEFYFTYLLHGKLPEMIPRTYKNAMVYLEAKRHFDKYMADYNKFQKIGLRSLEEH